MDHDEYNRLRRKAYDDFHNKVGALPEFTALLNARDHMLQAIELVWELSQSLEEDAVSESPTPSPNGHTNGHYVKGDLIKAITRTVSGFDGTFTIRDVERTVREENPTLSVKRPSLSSALRRLTESGAIEIVEQGSGRRPTTFKIG